MGREGGRKRGRREGGASRRGVRKRGMLNGCNGGISGERGGREIRELEGKKWGKKRDKEKEI